jgi:hypothetical protein
MNLFTSQSDYSLNFNGREFSYGSISYVNDTEKPYSVSFYYSPLNYDVKTSNDSISIKGGKSPDYSECEEFYDGLYSEFKTRYGEPDETYDEDYVYNTWKNTPDGDIWLCKGKNLWSTDGYNDVILTYTKSGFDYSTIRD